MKLLLAASVAVLFTACASEPQAMSVAATGDTPQGTVCSREYPIGSNIPVTKCRTREQMETEKSSASEALQRTQTGGSGARLGDMR